MKFSKEEKNFSSYYLYFKDKIENDFFSLKQSDISKIIGNELEDFFYSKLRPFLLKNVKIILEVLEKEYSLNKTSEKQIILDSDSYILFFSFDRKKLERALKKMKEQKIKYIGKLNDILRSRIDIELKKDQGNIFNQCFKVANFIIKELIGKNIDIKKLDYIKLENGPFKIKIDNMITKPRRNSQGKILYGGRIHLVIYNKKDKINFEIQIGSVNLTNFVDKMLEINDYKTSIHDLVYKGILKQEMVEKIIAKLSPVKKQEIINKIENAGNLYYEIMEKIYNSDYYNAYEKNKKEIKDKITKLEELLKYIAKETNLKSYII